MSANLTHNACVVMCVWESLEEMLELIFKSKIKICKDIVAVRLLGINNMVQR